MVLRGEQITRVVPCGAVRGDFWTGKGALKVIPRVEAAAEWIAGFEGEKGPARPGPSWRICTKKKKKGRVSFTITLYSLSQVIFSLSQDQKMKGVLPKCEKIKDYS